MKKEESSGDTIPESENIVEWRGHMEEFQIIDNCLMVKLPQEIDHHRAGFISEKADQYLLSDKVMHVVFDFENTIGLQFFTCTQLLVFA